MATLQSTTINGSIEVPDGSTGSPAIVASGDTDTGIFFPGDNSISFVTGGQVAMNINSSGYVTKPRHPLLNAGDSRSVDLTTVELNSTNFYNIIVYNQGSRFDAGTGRFTATVPGFYQATWWNNQAASGPNTNVRIRLNGLANIGPLAEAWNQSGSAGCINVWVTCVIYLNVNDYIDVQVARLTTNAAIQHKRFHIRFLG
jgi:hypothetical protein